MNFQKKRNVPQIVFIFQGCNGYKKIPLFLQFQRRWVTPESSFSKFLESNQPTISTIRNLPVKEKSSIYTSDAHRQQRQMRESVACRNFAFSKEEKQV